MGKNKIRVKYEYREKLVTPPYYDIVREYCYFATPAIAMNLTDDQVDELCGPMLDRNKKSHSSMMAFPIAVQSRCIRLNEFIGKAPISANVVQRMHDAIRLAFPCFAEVYDNMPKSIIDKANIQELYNRYLKSLNLQSMNIYAAAAYSSGVGDDLIPVIDYLEYKRFASLPAGHPFINAITIKRATGHLESTVEMFCPVNGRLMPEDSAAESKHLSDALLGYIKDEEEVRSFIHGDLSYPALYLYAAFKSYEMNLKRPISLTMKKEKMSEALNKFNSFILTAFSKEYKGDYMRSTVTCASLTYISMDEIFAILKVSRWIDIPVSDGISYYCYAKCFTETILEREELRKKNAALTLSLEKCKETEEKAKEKLAQQNRIIHDSKEEYSREKRKCISAKDAEIDKLKKTLQRNSAHLHETEIKLNNATRKIKELESSMPTRTAKELPEDYYSDKEKLRYLSAELESLQSAMENASAKLAEASGANAVDESIGTAPICDTDANIVIFGGYSKWVRSMQSIFPKVKFVETDNFTFDTDIVRRADCIWFQANYMAHKTYNKAATVARNSSIPIRYFSTNGVKECIKELRAFIDTASKGGV